MPEKKIVFATFFPGCRNFHLTKDVGMIPYILYRDFGYDSYVICHGDDEYSYLDSDVRGLKLWPLGKSRLHALEGWARSRRAGGRALRAAEALCAFFDALPFMLRHARRIDVLQVYHYKDESIIAAFLYRLFNPGGIVYLKLDLHPDVVELCLTDPARVKSSPAYGIARFDAISVEYREALDVLRRIHPVFKGYADRLYYVPNGIDAPALSRFYRDFGRKEDLVIHAGRLGMPQKASEVALEAFARVSGDFPGWRLVLIGTMEEGFSRRLAEFVESHGDAGSRITYAGFLEAREDVYEYYGRAKVCIFPSLFESFGLVALEAGCMGDALLASDIPPVRDLTDGGRYGYLCSVGDVDCFAAKLRRMMTDGDETARSGAALSGYVRKAFDWSPICANLHGIFTRLRAEGGRGG